MTNYADELLDSLWSKFKIVKIEIKRNFSKIVLISFVQLVVQTSKWIIFVEVNRKSAWC